MIPKTIHYCWFGRNPLPKSALKCIDSWRAFFPEYEIIEWNESNYDVHKIPYVSEAYDVKKYAFVSDYARFDILYNEGGLYFDTDVEVIKSFDDILKLGSFMGCEIDGDESSDANAYNSKKRSSICVNPGLGIAANPGMDLYKDILDYYKTQSFVLNDGTFNTETVVEKTTSILIRHGLQNIKGIQKISDVMIYPKVFFNPYNNNTGQLFITENTHSIHWYDKTWLSLWERLRSSITRPLHRIFGDDCFSLLK